MSQLVRIAHSPDSDDAFMFYALTQGRLDISGLEISHVLRDIETLNRAAFESTYEISAISFHAYAYLADRYALMPSGASFGDGYGPVVVTRTSPAREEFPGARDGDPGRADHRGARPQSSGSPAVRTVVVPFDQILEEVASGKRRCRRRHPRGAADLSGGGARARSSTSGRGGSTRPGIRCRSAATGSAATSIPRARAASAGCSPRASPTGSSTAPDALLHA